MTQDEVVATTPAIVDLDEGDDWNIGICVPDGSTIAVAVTAPDGTVTNPSPEVVGGDVTVVVPTDQVGRYLAVLTVSGDVAAVVPFVANTAEPSTAADMPDLTEVKAYLSTNGNTSTPDAAITEALNAEAAAQRKRCNVPAVYPDDLREALKRRVARNLAARAVPVAQVTSFEGGQTSTRVPFNDAEVARLEGPYRKVVLA